LCWVFQQNALQFVQMELFVPLDRMYGEGESMNNPFAGMSDEALEESLQCCSSAERTNLVAILQQLQEMDRRRLAERRAFPSLFEYCATKLRWAEGETARRIQVSRAAVRVPRLLSALRRGLLSLSTAALIVPHLDRKNCARLLRSSYGQRKRAVERLVAELSPQAEPQERVRFLGVTASTPEYRRPAEAPDPETENTVFPAPLEMPREPAPQRVHFSFTADERLLAKVERARDLLMGKYPDPDYEKVFEEGVAALLDRIDPDLKNGRAGSQPESLPGEPRSRVPPSWVKRTVWKRDGGHCSFQAAGGRRCQSTAGLQYDHIVPYALGGRSDDPANIRLLCRTHNRLEARRSFGDAAVEAAIAAAGRKGKALPGEAAPA
jgi:hypothetical protein